MGGFVLGVEGSFHLANITGTATSVHGVADDVMTTQVKTLATAVARLGFAVDNWLFYARGGYAGGKVNASWVDAVGGLQGPWAATAWHHGWQAGLGIEVGMSHNMVLGLEYNYTRLQTAAHTGIENPSAVDLTYNIGAAFHSVGVRLTVLFGGM